MLEARKTGVLRSRYEVSAAGRLITTWEGAFWKNGGSFELDGRRYQVGSNAWGSRYDLYEGEDVIVASANRVGRKRWTVEAAGQTYEFQRASLWSNEQELRVNGQRMGSVRRTSAWRGDVSVDLPGLPMPLQIFVLGVVITMWQQQEVAASGG